VTYASTVLADSPTGYWKLNESAGPTATDSASSPHNGTYAGTGVTYSVAGPLSDGSADTVVTLASTGQVSVAAFANLPIPLSIEFWLKTTASINGGTYIEHGDTASTGFRVMDAGGVGGVNGQMAFRCQGVGTIVLSTSTNYNDGNWHHVVITHDSINTRFYKDGVADGAPANTNTETSSSATLYIGCRNNADSFINGSIGQVAVYGSVLSAATVLAHYYAGLAVQRVRPAADVSDGNWLNEAGSNTNLYASIDEVTASAIEYIESSASPASADVAKVRLEPLTDPAVGTGHIVRYQYLKNQTGGDTINLTVTLRQADGTTSVASQGHTNISAVTDGSFTLSSGEADSIPSADYGVGLILEFSAVKA
jgi:hypothetical protein